MSGKGVGMEGKNSPGVIAPGDLLYPALAVVLLLVAWQSVVVGFAVPAYVLPSPVVVAAHFGQHWGFLLTHSWVTTYETLGGFFLSVVVGVPLAMAIVYSPLLDRTVTPASRCLANVP